MSRQYFNQNISVFSRGMGGGRWAVTAAALQIHCQCQQRSVRTVHAWDWPQAANSSISAEPQAEEWIALLLLLSCCFSSWSEEGRTSRERPDCTRTSGLCSHPHSGPGCRVALVSDPVRPCCLSDPSTVPHIWEYTKSRRHSLLFMVKFAPLGRKWKVLGMGL